MIYSNTDYIDICFFSLVALFCAQWYPFYQGIRFLVLFIASAADRGYVDVCSAHVLFCKLERGKKNL